MYFSGKISNSFISFLKRCGFDVSRFFEMTPLEMDFLKDPHSWLNARELERLLHNMEAAYGGHFMDKTLTAAVGHSSPSLQSWGGLEDFLKMPASPYEIYEKLEPLLSYFVSPALKITRKERSAAKLSFKASFPEKRYPHVKGYLAAVLESLPLFMGEGLTKAEWEGGHVAIHYPEEKNLTLPLGDRRSFPPSAWLLSQLKHCQKSLKEFQKTGMPSLVEDALKSLSQMKKHLKKKGPLS